MSVDVAIVGGGAAGVLSAIHVLRAAAQPLKIVLFERSRSLGDGIAYETRRPEHLLNVVAGRMSAFADDPTHFVRYLVDETPTLSMREVAASFIERRRYGAYLRACLDDARKRSPATLDIVHDEIVALESRASVSLVGRSCRETSARKTILALGNWPRPLPAAWLKGSPDKPILQAWEFEAIGSIEAHETVVIVGAGLSMVDALLTLAANRHRGAIHVVSRHALFPQTHAAQGTASINLELLGKLPVSKRVALLRATADELIEQGAPWQWVMDAVRPFVTPLWKSLNNDEQRRFLRHAVRFWDVHRHRIAPEAAAVVNRLRRKKQLVVHKGRISRIEPSGNAWLVDVQGRRSSTTCIAHRIINCLGMQPDIARVKQALVSSLIERGLVRAGPHGIGFDTASNGALISKSGVASSSLYAIGSVRIGDLWESVAIPELRVQAASLARVVTAAQNDSSPAATPKERLA